MSLKDPKNKALLDGFIMEHAPLVHKVFNILKSKGQLPQEVVEDPTGAHTAGFHGLIEALHLYNPEIAANTAKKGDNTFAKYAESRIRGRMRDHADSFHAIPKHIRQKANNLAAISAPAEETTEAPPQIAPKTPIS
jgi:DNA-directed RNA polymerase specialized sigma subunit